MERGEVARRPAHVVLLRRQADLLERLEGAEPLVTPGAGELARDPRVGGLADREPAALVFTQQHLYTEARRRTGP